MTTPNPSSFDEKEVYAFFGLSAYHAQVLERALINYIAGDKLKKEEHISPKNFDQIFNALEEKTLGRLIGEIRHLIDALPGYEAIIKESLNNRNFLIHNFFWHYAEDFISEDGRRKMIVKLREMTENFMIVSSKLEEATLILLKQKGIPKERVIQIFNYLAKKGEY